jgi:hypothetical protein
VEHPKIIFRSKINNDQIDNSYKFQQDYYIDKFFGDEANSSIKPIEEKI